MQAFEVSHFWRIPGFHQGFKTGFDQLDRATAQNGLLAKQIGLSFFAEIGFNNAGLTTTIGHGIAQCQITGTARFVLMNRDKVGNTAALCVGSTHGVARRLGRDHPNVQIGAGINQAVMDIETMGKHQRGA